MAREQTGAAGRRKANGAANTKPPKAEAGGKDELLKYYRDMLLIRRFEERAGQLYGMGLVYESFNMAELWSLPVVYVIENNQYAMGTAVDRSSAETHLYKRGASFRIPGEEVDGMDVLAVKAAAAKAAEHARSGKGPYILEMKTYRYRGHSMSDPAKYRTRDEVDEIRKTRDPIDHAEELLEKAGFADEAALKAIDAEVKRIVADAAEFARTSPEPDPKELYTDVYTDAPVGASA